ncbi:MAG: hypothetical protein IKX91_04370 [Firmicutes bacterium]|nr:hypothetical protein [Bacillota bacterium]
MMTTIPKTVIQQQLHSLDAMIARAETVLANAPAGTVRARRKGNCSWLIVTDPPKKGKPRKSRYVSLKTATGRRYAEKLYCKSLLPSLIRERDALRSLRDLYNPFEKYDSVRRAGSIVGTLIDPSLLLKTPKEQNDTWEAEPFETNPFPLPDNVEYVTEKGEHVRSRAECIIADYLHTMSIPYRYECALTIAGRTFYPDFTIRHPETGAIYYLEYFGMMDDPVYVSKALIKLQNYAKSPFCDRFLYLFESVTTPLSTVAVRNLLTRVFLDPPKD